MKRAATVLSALAALSAIASACAGVFYAGAGEGRTVENRFGQEVALYGSGVYANDSLLKVGATKGTDLVVIAAGLILLALLFVRKNKGAVTLLRTGLLSIILYASACLVMGVSMNRLFLLYVLQFGSSLFAFVLSLQSTIGEEAYREEVYERRLTGTGIFLIVSGLSVLIWLTFIVPVMMTGQPMETIEVYTTEPTFALDLAIILPSALFSGIMLLKKRKIGYRIAPVLLTLLTGIGLCVISQTIFQRSLGIALLPGQLFGLVGSFVVLGTVAAALNVRLLKYAV
jgi:hypothetical protein